MTLTVKIMANYKNESCLGCRWPCFVENSLKVDFRKPEIAPVLSTQLELSRSGSGASGITLTKDKSVHFAFHTRSTFLTALTRSHLKSALCEARKFASVAYVKWLVNGRKKML
jgi:hypothetical protein